MVIAGLFVILAHAEWKWLDTTVSNTFCSICNCMIVWYWQDLNYSHQVLGIIALSAVVVNVSES